MPEKEPGLQGVQAEAPADSERRGNGEGRERERERERESEVHQSGSRKVLTSVLELCIQPGAFTKEGEAQEKGEKRK